VGLQTRDNVDWTWWYFPFPLFWAPAMLQGVTAYPGLFKKTVRPKNGNEYWGTLDLSS
jgi:hypothetical protein